MPHWHTFQPLYRAVQPGRPGQRVRNRAQIDFATQVDADQRPAYKQSPTRSMPPRGQRFVKAHPAWAIPPHNRPAISRSYAWKVRPARCTRRCRCSLVSWYPSSGHSLRTSRSTGIGCPAARGRSWAPYSHHTTMPPVPHCTSSHQQEHRFCVRSRGVLCPAAAFSRFLGNR